MNYRKLNVLLGWLVFLIATTVYFITLEDTVSLWDCGEYIMAAYKLEVGHPPGAPLFMLLGRLFTFFAIETDVALWINRMSALSSSFTILFMFWSLTILLKKVLIKETTSNESLVMILGSAFVASLAFTFTDTFWYSAVEAEVYAMATFFIALLFWLGLRWEQAINTPKGNRWLLLISFVCGLAFGVHLMALLTIPSIILLYLFKTSENITLKKGIIFSVISVLILLVIYGMLIPFVLELFGRTVPLQVTDINVGILYIFGVVSLGVYGIMIGGWASNNKYSLMGAIRGASQNISYEIAMGLSIIALLLVTNTLSFKEIAEQQHSWHWNIIYQPLGFLIFLICAFAETNRVPFDLPECETELVGGFHTEYSAMKLGLFLFGEYVNLFISSALITTLFLGSYNFPGLAWIGENCFSILDAPVMRCASLDTPIPFNMELEKNFMARARLDEMVQKLISY